jgi:NADH-quinone oxidoreductase subunit G
MPLQAGMHTQAMLHSPKLKALFLLNTEPLFDCAQGASAVKSLADKEMVVTLSPFKANMDFSDVLMPISPFTETAGSFINTEARVQSFHGVVRPLGETRPAWKVLRVLANMLGVSGFDYDSVDHIRGDALPADWLARLGNDCHAPVSQLPAAPTAPITAGIYQLDGLVRRAPSLQLTADARSGEAAHV